MNDGMNRTQVTEAPMDIIHERLMDPADLMYCLIVTAAELSELDTAAGGMEPDIITRALRPIAVELSVEDDDIDEMLAMIAARREATAKRKMSEECLPAAEHDDLFLPIKESEAVAVVTSLTDTMVWMTTQADRRLVAELICFLRIFWGLDKQ